MIMSILQEGTPLVCKLAIVVFTLGNGVNDRYMPNTLLWGIYHHNYFMYTVEVCERFYFVQYDIY